MKHQGQELHMDRLSLLRRLRDLLEAEHPKMKGLISEVYYHLSKEVTPNKGIRAANLSKEAALERQGPGDILWPSMISPLSTQPFDEEAFLTAENVNWNRGRQYAQDLGRVVGVARLRAIETGDWGYAIRLQGILKNKLLHWCNEANLSKEDKAELTGLLDTTVELTENGPPIAKPDA